MGLQLLIGKNVEIITSAGERTKGEPRQVEHGVGFGEAQPRSLSSKTQNSCPFGLTKASRGFVGWNAIPEVKPLGESVSMSSRSAAISFVLLTSQIFRLWASRDASSLPSPETLGRARQGHPQSVHEQVLQSLSESDEMPEYPG